ncbi:MAG: VirB4 family type IV secretion system protein [Opitutales bacterium]
MKTEEYDGQIDSDSIIFANAKDGLVWVGKALLVSFPNTENAPVGLLNQQHREMRLMLQNAIAPGMRMQLNFRSDTSVQEDLNPYYEDTRDLDTVEWSRRQRDYHYVRHSRAVQKGTLRYTGAELILSRSVEMTNDVESSDDLLKTVKASLQRALSEIQRGFERAGGDAHLMGEEDLQRSFCQYFNPGKYGKTTKRVDYDPSKSVFENCFDGEIETPSKGGYIHYNGNYHGFVGMERMPQATTPGGILPLCSLPFSNYSLTLRIEPIDAQQVIAKEERACAKLRRAMATSKQSGLGKTIEVKQERIDLLMSEDVKPFSIQFYARVWEPTVQGLEKKLDAIKTAFKLTEGATGKAIKLPTSCRNTFIACMPGATYVDSSFKLYVECIHLASLLPVAGNSVRPESTPQAFVNAENQALHGVNLFGREPTHAFVSGATGSGKSVFQQSLLAETQPHWQKLVIVDVGFSYSSYVKTFPGDVRTLVIEPYGKETLNYMSTGGKPLKPKHYDWVDGIVGLMSGSFAVGDSIRKSLISRKVRGFFEDWGKAWIESHEHDAELTYEESYGLMSDDEQPTHADFHDWLEQHAEGERYFDREVQELILVLEKWRRDRGGYHLFDGVGTISLDADVIHLELSKISDGDEELKAVASFVVGNWVRSHIMGLPGGLRKVVVLEELGAFLQIPGGKAFLRDMMERMRKHNTAVLCTIQQLSLLPEDLATSVLGNSGQAFLFGQNYEQEVVALQKAFKLPHAAAQRLLQFGPPTPEEGAQFLHCIFNEKRRRVVSASSISSPEAIYLSSSSGGHLEEREMVLGQYDDFVDGVYAEVAKSQQTDG